MFALLCPLKRTGWIFDYRHKEKPGKHMVIRLAMSITLRNRDRCTSSETDKRSLRLLTEVTCQSSSSIELNHGGLSIASLLSVLV